MRIGITLPQFRASAADAVVAARAADADERIDGVFVFDHLWAIGDPSRPSVALWPLLGAVAGVTERVAVGSLVARVSLMADSLVAHAAAGVSAIAGPGRFIAGLGAGDRLSKPENEAYGIAFPPLDERLAALERTARLVLDRDLPVWIGGRSSQVHDVARRLRVPVNLWEAPIDEVATLTPSLEVTWGGVVADHPEGTEALLRSLRDVGVTWAVLAPPYVPGTDTAKAVKTIGDAISAT